MVLQKVGGRGKPKDIPPPPPGSYILHHYYGTTTSQCSDTVLDVILRLHYTRLTCRVGLGLPRVAATETG